MIQLLDGGKAYKEIMLYVIGRNIIKYRWLIHHKVEKFERKKGVENGLRI